MSQFWMDRAMCQHFHTLPWIAEPRDVSQASQRAMTLVCSVCQVHVDCAAFVEREGIISGFWAGADRTPITGASSVDGAA